MSERIASFLMTIGLIVWRVFDITRGNHTALNWILIGIFAIMGLFELGAIVEESEKRHPQTAAGTPDADALPEDKEIK